LLTCVFIRIPWQSYAKLGTVRGMADDDQALAALRQRWPDYSIYRAWWGWYAIPKGCELVSALYADSLDEQLRQHDEGPAR
jgi:hypothetical protein